MRPGQSPLDDAVRRPVGHRKESVNFAYVAVVGQLEQEAVRQGGVLLVLRCDEYCLTVLEQRQPGIVLDPVLVGCPGHDFSQPGVQIAHVGSAGAEPVAQ